MVSAEEVSKGPRADSRQSVSDTLTSYSGSDVHTRLDAPVALVRVKKVPTGAATQVVTKTKRKRDASDDNVAQPPSKKPRLVEATASFMSGVDFARLSLGQPTFRFGQSTSASARATASLSVASLLPAMPSTTGRQNPNKPPAGPTSSTATPAVVFSQPISMKPATRANPPSDCDEQFTFTDRRSSGPQPYNGRGTARGNRPSAQNARSTQETATSPTAPPQEDLGSTAGPSVYKFPFTGIDLSSLKIPANSNVNLTLNVFQAPSSVHQKLDSPVLRKLNCIQCKESYIETQNTAMNCRRHTGRGIPFPPPYVPGARGIG